MNKYPDFWHTLIGNGAPGAFFGYTVMAFVCAITIILIDVSNRNVASTSTPVKISWRFFWADNVTRVVADILLVPITIRLCYEYVPPVGMLFLSCGIGFGVEGLAMIAKRFGILTTNKLAAKVAEKLAPNEPNITPKP